MTATTQPVLFDIDSMSNMSILISFLSILMHFMDILVFATELVTGKMVSLPLFKAWTWSQRRWTVFVLPL